MTPGLRGFTDGFEVNAGTNPLVPDSPPIDDLLCAYWPLDGTDGVTTPDLGPNGYHLDLVNMNAGNFVPDGGRIAASFNGIDTMLVRVHDAGDGLPITQHGSYTISMWVKIKGTGQNDLRFFSESTNQSNDPLLNLGTRNNGSDDTIDVFLRDGGSPGHQFSVGQHLDGTWRHILYTHSDAEQKIQLYVDGVLDRDDWSFKDITFPLNTTTVGGILRANPSHWVTGLVDEVSLWKSVLSPVTIEKLASGVTVLDLLDPSKLALDITKNGDELMIQWDSKPGHLYNLRSETDPSNGDPKDWPIYGGNMDVVATPNTNSLTLPFPGDSERFFVIEEFPAPPVTVFSDDLESGLGDWTMGSNEDDGSEWELGTPTNVGPVDTKSGVNCFGTNLDGDYGLLADVWLRTPAIDLTNATGATLHYAEFKDMEGQGFDFGTIILLNAADDSKIVEVVTDIDGADTEWQNVSLNLPAEALGKVIKLEFRMVTDDFVGSNFPGWYIDDVAVTTPAP